MLISCKKGNGCILGLINASKNFLNSKSFNFFYDKCSTSTIITNKFVDFILKLKKISLFFMKKVRKKKIPFGGGTESDNVMRRWTSKEAIIIVGVDASSRTCSLEKKWTGAWFSLARAFARHGLSVPYHRKLHGTRRVQVRRATRRQAVSTPGSHPHRKVETVHEAYVV